MPSHTQQRTQQIHNYTVSQKNMRLRLRQYVELEWSVYNNFWHTYYQEYRPLIDIFIFPSHLSCTSTLPWETVKTQISVKKKDKIMKISQEDVILIKNLYLPKQYGARRLFSELSKRWKPGSFDSLLKTICKTGTTVRQPGSGRPCLSHRSGGPCAQSGGHAKKASINS